MNEREGMTYAASTTRDRARVNGYGIEGRALDILDLLSDKPMTQAECCETLEITKSQFRAGLQYLRDFACPELDVAIPHPVPEDGFRYHVTGEWVAVDGTPAIHAGTQFALGLIERRLQSVMRDVGVAIVNLDHSSWDYRKAKFMNRKLVEMFGTLTKMAAADTRKREAV